MNKFLNFAFLFFIGSVFGWVAEVFYRRFISSSNPERKWLNPGFCTGPYLPLYGFGISAMYFLSSLEYLIPVDNLIFRQIILFAVITLIMTGFEFFAGIILLKCFKLRLWDYTDNKWNIKGLICPLYTFFWAVLGIIYYYLVHPYILNTLQWLSENLAFSFVIGLFYGVFLIDVIHSGNIVTKIKAFAEENNVIIKYENLKSQIRSKHEHLNRKIHFIFVFKSEIPLIEHLKNMLRKN